MTLPPKAQPLLHACPNQPMPDTALSIKQLYIPGKMITSGTIVGS